MSRRAVTKSSLSTAASVRCSSSASESSPPPSGGAFLPSSASSRSLAMRVGSIGSAPSAFTSRDGAVVAPQLELDSPAVRAALDARHDDIACAGRVTERAGRIACDRRDPHAPARRRCRSARHPVRRVRRRAAIRSMRPSRSHAHSSPALTSTGSTAAVAVSGSIALAIDGGGDAPEHFRTRAGRRPRSARSPRRPRSRRRACAGSLPARPVSLSDRRRPAAASPAVAARRWPAHRSRASPQCAAASAGDSTSMSATQR